MWELLRNRMRENVLNINGYYIWQKKQEILYMKTSIKCHQQSIGKIKMNYYFERKDPRKLQSC